MAGFAHDSIVPDKASEQSKKEQVAGMFDDIAHRYDFMNRFLSAGIDVFWRKKALSKLAPSSPRRMLDVATGTAEVAIMATKMLKPEKVVGIDISEGMLEIGRKKVAKAGLSDTILLQSGDSEAIEAADATYDAVTVAFGVRNFADLTRGLSEIRRVLKPGGRLVVLEFSKPRLPGVKTLYGWYMNRIAPGMGGIFTRNPAAYRYLHDSVQNFPEGQAFLQVLGSVGFKDNSCERLSLGICSIYCATR